MFNVHNDMIGRYLARLCTPGQRERWLPGYCSGELITAIAMTEPGAGSDLQGIRTTAVPEPDGEHYVLGGQKTFISNGQLADLVIVVARTDPAAGHRGISSAGGGFVALMENLPRERVTIGVFALAVAEKAFEDTLAYTKQRRAFGVSIGGFQHSKFLLAEMATELAIARAFTDKAIMAHVDGELTTQEASMVKWWNTDLCNRVADRCVQLHGGYGYMREYGVARAWADSRVMAIFGGTNEIQKEIIGRGLGL
jgi:alkylation response protein AidB-like acyl-CoA dehydrogenase